MFKTGTTAFSFIRPKEKQSLYAERCTHRELLAAHVGIQDDRGASCCASCGWKHVVRVVKGRLPL